MVISPLNLKNAPVHLEEVNIYSNPDMANWNIGLYKGRIMGAF